MTALVIVDCQQRHGSSAAEAALGAFRGWRGEVDDSEGRGKVRSFRLGPPARPQICTRCMTGPTCPPTRRHPRGQVSRFGRTPVICGAPCTERPATRPRSAPRPHPSVRSCTRCKAGRRLGCPPRSTRCKAGRRAGCPPRSCAWPRCAGRGWQAPGRGRYRPGDGAGGFGGAAGSVVGQIQCRQVQPLAGVRAVAREPTTCAWRWPRSRRRYPGAGGPPGWSCAPGMARGRTDRRPR